ncbi:MAG: hypothetical protein ACPGVT_10910 [Maricaulaceae bacterium]
MFPLEAKATLDVDGARLATNTSVTHLNPNVPLISVQNISDDIHSIDVFIIGVFSIKAAISVNGDIMHQDNISSADRMQAKVFEA